MKSRTMQFLILFAGLLAATAASAGNESTAPSPVAFLPETIHTFKPVYLMLHVFFFRKDSRSSGSKQQPENEPSNA